MIQEVWVVDVKDAGDGSSWPVVADHLKRFAEIAVKDELVLDAWGARSETGDVAEFRKAYIVMVFDSVEARTKYYANGMSDDTKKVFREGKKYYTNDIAHYYLNVYK